MIQLIRIIQKKGTGIYSSYIMEFLKLIGCMIQDCEITKNHIDKIREDDYFDVNIFIDISTKELYGEAYDNIGFVKMQQNNIYLPLPKGEEDCEKLKNIIENMIDKIWNKESDIQKEIKEIGKVYNRFDLFYYLYHQGSEKNVKFQQVSDGLDAATDTTKIIFDKFVDAYNMLYEYKKDKNNEYSMYLEHSIVLMMYKINKVSVALRNEPVFHTYQLLKIAINAADKVNEFIRFKYLLANICKEDMKYVGYVERFFEQTLELIEIRGNVGTKDFIYYRMGNYYEKIKKDEALAETYYKKALEINGNYYSVLLKLAEKSDFNKTLEYCNRIIDSILDDVNINVIMPKQQIIIYKAYIVIARLLREMKINEYAVEFYDVAKKIAQIEIAFYQYFDYMEDNDLFKQMTKKCMIEVSLSYERETCLS